MMMIVPERRQRRERRGRKGGENTRSDITAVQKKWVKFRKTAADIKNGTNISLLSCWALATTFGYNLWL